MRSIYFSSAVCVACREMAPIIKKLRDRGYQIERLDTNQFKEKAKQYKIKALPTTIFLDGDRETSRLVGKFTESEFVENYTTYNIW